MNQEQIWNDFSALPPKAQQIVADLITFLRSAQNLGGPNKNGAEKLLLDDEPFFGMWRDRKDMADSTQWVRNLRTTEWGLPGE